MALLTVAALVLGVAVAGPRTPDPQPPEPAPPLDIAVAVDVSRSMGATDVEASRIERARLVVDRLAEGLPSARIVLVLFADWPYTLVPPTDDPALVRYFARSLSADLVLDRDQGTSLSAALAHARAALDERSRPGARRAIVVLSDGGAHEDETQVLQAAATASEGGVTVYTAGIGTRAGGPVVTEAGPLVDGAGRPVLASLDDGLLRAVARDGGGSYQDVSDDGGLRAFLAEVGTPEDAPLGEGGGPLDTSFLLTLLAVPLLLWEAGLDAGRRVGWRRRGAEA
jgi:Ca-activated chloride channel family protein